MRTWGDASTAATARLRSAPDPHTAALDADVLLAHVLGVGKEALYAHPERELSAAEDGRFQELVEMRAEAESVLNECLADNIVEIEEYARAGKRTVGSHIVSEDAPRQVLV